MASIKLKDYLESLSIKGTISANDLVPILDSEASNVLKTSTQSTLVDAAAAAIADITAYTASLDGALEIDGSDVTILGNLNVQGTQTIIDSTTINLGDNIIQLNGTFNANGGIYVSDTTSGNDTGSLIWDGVTDSWKAGTIGAEIEIVTLSDSQVLTNKTINGSQLVNASVANGKLTNSSITIAGAATSLGGTITAQTIGDAIGAFSGSIQINHDATTNFVANEHIDHSGVTITAGNGLTGGGDITTNRTINVVSANNGIIANTDNIQLDTASSTFTDGVKSKLNTETTISGSSQIDHDSTTNFVADEHIAHSGVSITAGNGLTGGGDITTNRTINVVSANNGIVANADNIQLDTASSTFTDGVKAKLNSETVVSGSSQVDHDSTTNFVANEHIDHSGVTITAGNGLTGGGTIEATRTLNVVSANNGIVANADNIQLDVASSTFTDGVKSKLNSETVVSGSSQIDVTQTTNYGSINQYTDSDTLVYINSLAVQSGSDTPHYTDSDTLSYINSINVVSGSSQLTKTLQEVTDAGASTSNAIRITNTTTSAAKTTGALVVDGGLGVGGSITANLVQVYSATPKMMVTNNDSTIVNGQTVGSYQFRHTDADGGGNGSIFSIDLVATADFEGLNNTPAEYQFDTGINVDGDITASSFDVSGSINVTSHGADGLILNEDGSNATLSSRLFFMNNQTTGWAIHKAANHLEFKSGSIPNSSSGVAKLKIYAGTDNVEVTDGNLVIGTAGKGIDFSATSDGSGTTTSELLDDYEEGTWTPEVIGSTGTPTGVTYNYQGASYTKIGNTVWIRMGINIAGVGTGGTGTLQITGLPFTPANQGAYQEPTSMATGGRWVTAGNAGFTYAFVKNSETKLEFRTMASNADTSLAYSELQGGSASVGTWFTLVTFYHV